jgi:hypothetical protein
VNANAQDIDGAYDFDVTDQVLAMTREEALEIEDNSSESDNLWLENPVYDKKPHTGPFYVQVEADIQRFLEENPDAKFAEPGENVFASPEVADMEDIEITHMEDLELPLRDLILEKSVAFGIKDTPKLRNLIERICATYSEDLFEEGHLADEEAEEEE